MRDDEMNRRTFLGATSLALGAMAAPPAWPLARAADAAHAPPTVFVRPEIHSAAGLAMVGPYSAAVTQMRNWSAANPNDPRGWTYQANIHGFVTGPAKPAWATCQHGSFFFLSWHRMYLYYFERICRAASGNPNFVLPYWNYEPATQRLLPPAFRVTGSPLYDANRSAGINAGTAGIPAADADPSVALASPTFIGTGPGGFGGGSIPAPQHFAGAYGQLESRPHNRVHNDIGGDMGDPNRAAGDPIFWLHHANIDRLWSLWRRLDATHTNPSTAPWTTAAFTFFDETGAAVTLTGTQVVNTVTQLHYRYDTDPVIVRIDPRILAELVRKVRDPSYPIQEIVRVFRVPPRPWPPEPPAPWRNATLKAQAPLVMREVESTVSVPVAVAAIDQLKRASADRSRRVVLALEGITLDGPPGGTIDVFLAGGAAGRQQLATPRAKELYVGSIDYFALAGELHATNGVRDATITVDATPVLRAQLERMARAGDTLHAVFRFSGPADANDRPLPPTKPLQLGRVGVYVM